jgi:hypothetical protein
MAFGLAGEDCLSPISLAPEEVKGLLASPFRSRDGAHLPERFAVILLPVIVRMDSRNWWLFARPLRTSRWNATAQPTVEWLTGHARPKRGECAHHSGRRF